MDFTAGETTLNGLTVPQFAGPGPPLQFEHLEFLANFLAQRCSKLAPWINHAMSESQWAKHDQWSISFGFKVQGTVRGPAGAD
jgi:hypothetical protein